MILPHKLDRPHQLPTAQRIVQSEAKYIIVNAPTGSGKTAYAAYAASQGYRVLAIVKTKSLQRQYEKYGFTSITGKGDYHCQAYGQSLNGYGLELTTDLCEVPSSQYRVCQDNCTYPRARREFVSSQAGVTNYAKFLSDRKLIDDFDPDIIFLDEGHELSENIVIDFSGLTYDWKRSKKVLGYIDPIEILAPQPIALRLGSEWLRELYSSLKTNPALHPSLGGDVRLYKWHRRQLDEVNLTLAAMDIVPDCWFIKSDDKGFTCKPLTSQFHFLRLFDKAPKIVLMSATIQKPDIDALGIKDYEFIRVPNVIPSIMRPVYDLKAPEYKRSMSLTEKKEHAAIIAKVFKDRPSWNGIVHTTSESMANELADLIKNGNPIWIPERGTPTDKSYADWQEFNNQNEAAICISWQFFTGVDMGDVAINICARTPWPFFGDEYERTRFHYHRPQARVRIGNSLEQQMGRNRRGFNEHYGPNAKKFNAICDGKWYRLKSAMQKDFIGSVR